MTMTKRLLAILADLGTLLLVLSGVFITLIGGTLLMAALLGLILGAA
jgi:hypothetical protein